MLRKLSEDEVAEQWAYIRSRARIYFWLAMAPVLALIWGAGYVQGLLDDCSLAIRNDVNKIEESNK